MLTQHTRNNNMVPKSGLEFVPLHDTFVAEVRNVDFSGPQPDDVQEKLQEALHKYGVLVFRNTGLDDAGYVEFCSKFGQMEPPRNIDPRVGHPMLGMQKNVKADGTLTQKGDYEWYKGRSVIVFHHDASYDPARAAYTSIKAVQMPPRDYGGATQFTDTRTAYEDLDEDMKKFLDGKVATHSKFNTTKAGAPDYIPFQNIQPEKYFMSRQYTVYDDPHTGRKGLYIGHHIQYIEDMTKEDSDKLFKKLMDHCEQPKYMWSMYYENPTDVVLWSNLVTMHRAQPSKFAGKYIRELRRAVMRDYTDTQYGLNSKDIERIDTNAITDQHYHDWVAAGKPDKNNFELKKQAKEADKFAAQKKAAKEVLHGAIAQPQTA